MQQDIHGEKILILDFGSQYSQLIARRVRESRVYCEIHPFDLGMKAIREFKPRGIILSGGPQSVYQEGAPSVEEDLFDLGIPILGICYGMQLMVRHFGGRVVAAGKREYGHAGIVARGKPGPLFEGFFIEGKNSVWMSHGDHVEKVPERFDVVAFSENAPVCAIQNLEKHQYGVQFHPEVVHTLSGELFIENFVRHVCRCSGQWTPGSIIEDAVERVAECH